MTVVSGQVNEHGGAGVPGVFVSARQVGGRRFSVVPSTYTDLSGRWALDLAPGQWHVRETGFSAFELTVGATPVNTAGDAEPQVAPDPTTEDIARFMERRKAARTAPVTRNPDSELPVTGDVSAMLRERRGQ